MENNDIFKMDMALTFLMEEWLPWLNWIFFEWSLVKVPHTNVNWQEKF